MASQLFKFPINYQYGRQTFSVSSGNVRSGAPALSDGSFETSSTAKQFIFETYGSSRSARSRITHVFIRASGLTNFSISVPSGHGSGTALTNKVIPADQTINNVQFDLVPVGPLSATEVMLSVSGTTTQVYQVMLLEEILEFESNFTNVNPSQVDRGASIRTNIRGASIKAPGLSGRPKWSIGYSAIFLPGHSPTADQVREAFNSNPNFVWSEDFDRLPANVYAATLSGGVSISYLGRLWTQQQLDFTILEL